MDKNNIVIPFTVCDAEVKGRIVRLDQELDLILKQHQYPEVIAKILGELLVVVSMIASQFKDNITFSVQLRTEGKIKYIVADYKSPGDVRGYASFNEEDDFKDESYQSLVQDALLVVTLDQNNKSNQRYQGMVEVGNKSISEAMEEYFSQSEQIETSFKIAVGNIMVPGKQQAWCAGGIMIQEMPKDKHENAWDEAQIFFKTVKDHELLDSQLSIESLLYSLYHELNIKIYEDIEITHKCRCSRDKVEEVIKSFGLDEAISLLIDGKMSVNCQFCNISQEFSENEINKIFL
jgi:molecular chaperone Hsp33